jgi:hypothetical protein
MTWFRLSNVEYSRGIVTSLLSSGFTQILIYLSKKSDVENKDLILYIITFIVANLISYSFDILLAKDNFNGTRISIYDQSYRLSYMLRNIFGYQIVKYFILVCIDTLIVTSIFEKIRKILDDREIIFANRDQLLLFLITAFTFTLYGNMLRFEWVYVDNKRNLNLDVLLIAWLSILVFVKGV